MREQRLLGILVLLRTRKRHHLGCASGNALTDAVLVELKRHVGGPDFSFEFGIDLGQLE